MNGEQKITSSHRGRAAVVYLRQSSMAQVRWHTESTARQYALADEAARLGWARPDVVVIDTDLGVSGRWGVARAGFTDLVARVCTGQVGAIFGLEISRLARSNAEIARLMEFAAITDTLLIDADGVYDPSDVNDRMLLGLKGTMAQVELHVMAQRLQASKRAAAERGELRTPLPVGYVHDEDGAVVVDPDEQVQAAVRDLFAAFTRTGSAYAVVGAFTGRGFPLRAYGGAWAGQLRFGALTHARVVGVLHNPCYAGAYVHGRYASHRSVDPDGTVHTAVAALPRAQWPVLIQGHHAGYISWDDFLANQARLECNRTNAGARPPREGTALCQGIICCGSCGKPMRTNYHTDARPAYECSSRADGRSTPTCRSVTARVVDDAVADTLLAALNPAEVALTLAAAGQVTDRHQRTSRAAELAAQRARYTADRAERAFHQVEPENRLVARNLETRWETALAELAETEQALTAAHEALPPLPGPAELQALTADLPRLWNAATTSNKDRKRLLRTLIADITLLPAADAAAVRIGICWHTGAHQEITVARPLPPGPAKRSPGPAIDMVRRLGPSIATAELADKLNAAGLRTGHGQPFGVKAVQWIRHAYHIPAPNPFAGNEISVARAAEQLGCVPGVVYAWIDTGKLDARRGAGNRLCIPWTQDIQTRCRARITASGHLNPAARRGKPRTRTKLPQNRAGMGH